MKKLIILALIFASVLMLNFNTAYAVNCAADYCGDESGCTADGSCDWSATTGCYNSDPQYIDCTFILIQSDCAGEQASLGSFGCGWSSGSCVECTSLGGSTSCNAADGCSWDSANSVCVVDEQCCNDNLNNNVNFETSNYCDYDDPACGGLAVGTEGLITSAPAGTEFYLVSNITKAVWSGANACDRVRQDGSAVVITAEDSDGRAGRLTVDFSSGNVSLSGATIDSNPTAGKAVIYMSSWPAGVTQKDLLIPKLGGYTQAYKCPTAQSLAQVVNYCSGIVAGSSTTTINSTQYWLFTSVQGTGGGNGAIVPEFPGLTIFAAAALSLLGMAAIVTRYKRK